MFLYALQQILKKKGAFLVYSISSLYILGTLIALRICNYDFWGSNAAEKF